MSEKPFLKTYSGQTTDQLISLQEAYRIGSLILAFEQALDQKAERIGLEALTPEERVILAIEGLQREVNNGGYHQFFTNSSGQYAPIILDALYRIGCNEIVGITQRAIDLLGYEGPFTAEEIEERLILEDDDLMDELLEKFGEIDSAYYEASESIEDALFEFIKNHKGRITIP